MLNISPVTGRATDINLFTISSYSNMPRRLILDQKTAEKEMGTENEDHSSDLDEIVEDTDAKLGMFN